MKGRHPQHAPTKGEIIIILVLMFAVGIALLFLETKGVLQANAQAFDHSNCQYPERTTNPPDGCDNSDPANPYCAAKGLPEDCTEGQEAPPVQTPTAQPEATKLEPKKEVSSCGK